MFWLRQADASCIEPKRLPRMNDDASQIADHLIEQHGVDGALEMVREGIATAHANGDRYRLSVWRDVKRIIQDRRDAADNQDAPAV